MPAQVPNSSANATGEGSEDVKSGSQDEGGEEKDELNDFTDVKTTYMDAEESQLLRQAFMLNPSQSVHQYLRTHGVTITDFLRHEHGKETAQKKENGSADATK